MPNRKAVAVKAYHYRNDGGNAGIKINSSCHLESRDLGRIRETELMLALKLSTQLTKLLTK